MQNKFNFKIDYLNGIVPTCNVSMFFESLKNIDEKFELENWVSNCYAVRGIRNYDTRFHWLGKNEFIVSWNAYSPDDLFTAKSPLESKFNPYIYITVSGKALDNIDDKDRFFSYLFRIGFKATRLDVACDIYNSDNVIVPHILQSFKYSSVQRKPEGVSFVSSKMSLEPRYNKCTGQTDRPVKYISQSDVEGNITENLTFGNHGSYLGMFRVYNKYLERGLDCLSRFDPLFSLRDKLYPDKYWYRLEVELHRDHAAKLFNLYQSEHLEVYDVFASAIVSFFDIRVSRSRGYNVNLCPQSSIWVDFLAELSSSIHFVQLDKKESVPVVELPLEEIKEKLLHYAPMLIAYDSICELFPDFKPLLHRERFDRYDNKIQYALLRRRLDERRHSLSINQFNL